MLACSFRRIEDVVDLESHVLEMQPGDLVARARERVLHGAVELDEMAAKQRTRVTGESWRGRWSPRRGCGRLGRLGRRDLPLDRLDVGPLQIAAIHIDLH